MGTVSCGASWELTLSAGHGKLDYHAAQTKGWEIQPPLATLTGPALTTDVCRGWRKSLEAIRPLISSSFIQPVLHLLRSQEPWVSRDPVCTAATSFHIRQAAQLMVSSS